MKVSWVITLASFKAEFNLDTTVCTNVFQGKSTAMCYWKQPETQFPSVIQQQDSSHQHRAKRMPKLNQRKESYWQPPPGLASSGDFKYKHCLKLRLISLQMLKETQLTDTLLRPTSSLSSQQELSPKDNIWRTHPRNACTAPSPWAVSLELCPQPTDWASEQLFRDLAKPKSDRAFARPWIPGVSYLHGKVHYTDPSWCSCFQKLREAIYRVPLDCQFTWK